MTSRTGKRIVVADYDPAWPERFRAERELILRTRGAGAFVRIEHVGSTAVQGLAAKPIVDIMPGLRSLDDAPPLVPQLASIGYEYVPEYERDVAGVGPGMPFRRYFRKDEDGARAFHMHMVEVGSDFWADQLLFRDYLRAFPEAAQEYAALKRELAASYNALAEKPSIDAGYTEHKSPFIESAKAKARVARLDPRYRHLFDASSGGA